MKQSNLKSLWTESVQDSALEINKDKMLRMFEKSRSEEKVVRAFEFSDLFLGILLLFIVSLKYAWDSTIFDSIPIAGKIGGFVFVLTFIIYHTLSFRIRLMTVPNAPGLLDLLKFQLKMLNSRIGLLKSYNWFLSISISGIFLLIISISPTFMTGVVMFVIFGAFGSIVYFLAQKKVKQDFLPLKKETEDKIASLESQD